MIDVIILLKERKKIDRKIGWSSRSAEFGMKAFELDSLNGLYMAYFQFSDAFDSVNSIKMKVEYWENQFLALKWSSFGSNLLQINDSFF